MQVLNLRKEFKVVKMKENASIKDFTNKLLKVVTRIRLVGEKLSDQRVIEKILVCLLEMFESKIFSLKENKNFSQI
uniref:Retrovirus-related Pol polyprotein from transposon TNT 1-94 n=1 Tax=Cajanus cajan TaxID=3821 RepID=A0A151SY97_CAJCA|nr:hypothetical protein KK1_015141 [Cajanus cajan]